MKEVTEVVVLRSNLPISLMHEVVVVRRSLSKFLLHVTREKRDVMCSI